MQLRCCATALLLLSGSNAFDVDTSCAGLEEFSDDCLTPLGGWLTDDFDLCGDFALMAVSGPF